MSNETPSKTQERLSSPLTWHYVGVAVLIAVVIGLAVRLGMDWAATNSNSADAMAAKELQLKALEVQTAPLRGLDQRVADSHAQMKTFYEKRISPNYSLIAARVGDLQVKSGVHLTRLLYAQGAPSGDLTEISLDAGVTGAYPQIMRFVNGLERDQTFFVVRAMVLTGQQGGLVNLRLRVSTWLRAADAANSGLPTVQTQPTPSPVVAAGSEGE
jgi:type IV pilus assembly protein PilO